jgi:hypothetical protein
LRRLSSGMAEHSHHQKGENPQLQPNRHASYATRPSFCSRAGHNPLQRRAMQTRLLFDAHRRIFRCKTCDADCRHKIGPDHVPSEVWCTGCALVYYSGKSLPWRGWLTGSGWYPKQPSPRHKLHQVPSGPSSQGQRPTNNRPIQPAHSFHELASMYARITVSAEEGLASRLRQHKLLPRHQSIRNTSLVRYES